MAAKTKTKRYYSTHNVATTVSLAHKHQCTTAITMMWTQSSWAFPESYTTRSCAWAMVNNWETKWLITLPPRWVSAQISYVCLTAW